MKRYFSKSNIELLERVPLSTLIVAACFFSLNLVGVCIMSENQEEDQEKNMKMKILSFINPVFVSVINENLESDQQEDEEKRIKMENSNKIEPACVYVISENQERIKQEGEINAFANQEIESDQVCQVNSLGIR